MQYGDVEETITKSIRDRVRDAGAGGVVMGLSGGIDSAVVAYLCRGAMGNNCMALIMPSSGITPASETDDGVLVATRLGMEHAIVPIGPISDLYTGGGTLGGEFRNEEHRRLVVGNLNARIRAAVLYYEAQRRNYLVVGTDDRSEYLLGYFTKYGDGASDMLPIADLFKTEVRELAAHMGVPEHIISKQSSPHLWPGQTAAEELGVDYDRVDQVLRAMENSDDAEKISKDTNVGLDTVRHIMSLHKRSEHKRHVPPVTRLPTYT